MKQRHQSITSIESYIDYKKGKAQTKRAQVYNFIKEHPGCTRREISEWLEPEIMLNSATARVRELIVLGKIVETGEVACTITGKTVKTLAVSEASTKQAE